MIQKLSNWFRVESTRFLLWSLAKINRVKDNRLSQELFDLAEDYNTRPGTNNYPGFIVDKHD